MAALKPPLTIVILSFAFVVFRNVGSMMYDNNGRSVVVVYPPHMCERGKGILFRDF